MSRLFHNKALLFVVLVYACTVSGKAFAERDLYYSEALFLAQQGLYLEAISRLDVELDQYYSLDEPKKDSFTSDRAIAEFQVGDFELEYRMNQSTGRALKRILDADLPETVRNEAAYRLGRLYYRQGDITNAIIALRKIEGDMDETVRNRALFLQAQAEIYSGNFERAQNIIQSLSGVKELAGFADYNLAIAYLQNDQLEQGVTTMNRVGSLQTDAPKVLALKDKANLSLGYRLMEEKQPDQAWSYLSRVRLEGPFSNRALLGGGWAQVEQQSFRKAVVPWQILVKRDKTDAAVQEAWLALPYAYSQLKAYGRAALLYTQAMEDLANEVDNLDQSISSIRGGKFLKALSDYEYKRDPFWLINLSKQKDTPETRYLTQLMSSNVFTESLKNYRDLDHLELNLTNWSESIEAFFDIIQLRKSYYDPLLPKIEERFQQIEESLQKKRLKKASIEQKLDQLLVNRQPETLANDNELSAFNRLKQIKQAANQLPATQKTTVMERAARLEGSVQWLLESEFDQRQTNMHQYLIDLDEEIRVLEETRASFLRARQAAIQSYQGYDRKLKQLSRKVKQALSKVKSTKARQGKALEKMSMDALDARRKKLEEFVAKARFAMAESFDRAAAKQEKEREEQLRLEGQQQEDVLTQDAEQPAASDAPQASEETAQ